MKGSASELVLGLRALNLFQKPGAWEPLQKTVRAPGDLRIEVIGVEEGSDLHLDLQLESVVEGIYVSGTVRATAVGTDVRTLEPLSLDLEVPINELFAYDADSEEEDEVYGITGDRLDLEQAIRDAIVMALPFQPVADDADEDFSYTAGAAWEPESEAEDADPRWAALKSLLDEKKES